MKTNSDPENEDALLAAVLQDDGWNTANDTAKAQALGVFQARQRTRRWTRWGGTVAALAVAAAWAGHWFTAPVAPVPGRLAERVAGLPVAKAEQPTYLTDGELLALFPEGSCFLAEVDGKKKLVFYDPKVEREYVSEAGMQRAFAP